MDTIGLDIAFGSSVAGADIVEAGQFGGIQTGYAAFAEFDAQFDALGFSALRWPGGTLAETETDVYGLDIPGLFDGTRLYTPNPDRVRPDLTDTLAHCVANDLAFSMIVPTVRYAADIARGEAELAAFMGDLLSGRYGALPADFTLEIGNEYMGHAVLAGDPGLYGEIADRFISVIVEALASTEINRLGADVAIAVQMGQTAGDDAAIRAALSPESLAEIDSIVAHALPFNFGAIDRPEDDPGAHPDDFGETLWQNRQDYLDAWVQAIGDAGGDGAAVELFMSAMNVGKSAQDVDAVNLASQDYGLRAAGAYLELYATYQSIGMDAAAIWGIAGKHFNAVGTGGPGDVVLDPGGALLKLMAANIEGMALIDGFQANTRDDPAMAYAWENADQAVIFVAANDIAPEGLGIEIGLGLLQGASLLEAVRLSAVLSEDTPPDATGLELMVYEEARVEGFVPQVSGDVVSFSLGMDYEVVMLRIAKGPLPAGPTPVEGGAGADRIDGGAGADVILGHGGNDKLFGNDGDDRLEGGAGKDVLRGGLGNDTLDGGAGADQLHGGAGEDVVRGGDGDDEINGHGEADLLLGELGNDTILGGAGADRIDGGAGVDWIDGEMGDDWIEGGAGQDMLFGGLGSDTIFGGADDDLIDGAGGFDALHGGDGNDILSGGDGNDVLAGEDGDDDLDGGAGQDALSGGAGADMLRGDGGDDMLTGGADADRFVFDAEGFGADRIADFEAGLDVIDLSALGLETSWTDFAAACLSADADGVTVTVAGGTIELAGLALADLSAADFLI